MTKILSTFLLVLFVLLSFMGCKNDTKTVEQPISTVNDTLLYNERDMALEKLVLAFNDIEDNLSSITQTELYVADASDKNPDLQGDIKLRINDQMEIIDELLEENRQIIKALEADLKKSGVENNAMIQLIDRLNKKVTEKEMHVANLQEQLNDATVSLNQLTAENETMRKMLTEQEDETNTALLVYGTTKELVDLNIIEKKGGVLGIGRQKKLRNDFNDQYFVKMNLQDTRRIIIPGDKMTFITTHDTASFQLKEKNGRFELKINDVNSFWKASKYLVVVTD